MASVTAWFAAASCKSLPASMDDRFGLLATLRRFASIISTDVGRAAEEADRYRYAPAARLDARWAAEATQIRQARFVPDRGPCAGSRSPEAAASSLGKNAR